MALHIIISNTLLKKNFSNKYNPISWKKYYAIYYFLFGGRLQDKLLVLILKSAVFKNIVQKKNK